MKNFLKNVQKFFVLRVDISSYSEACVSRPFQKKTFSRRVKLEVFWMLKVLNTWLLNPKLQIVPYYDFEGCKMNTSCPNRLHRFLWVHMLEIIVRICPGNFLVFVGTWEKFLQVKSISKCEIIPRSYSFVAHKLNLRKNLGFFKFFAATKLRQ